MPRSERLFIDVELFYVGRSAMPLDLPAGFCGGKPMPAPQSSPKLQMGRLGWIFSYAVICMWMACLTVSHNFLYFSLNIFQEGSESV